jgi:superfamily II DNA or RNA helicase
LKIQLKTFQEVAVADLVHRVRQAQLDASNDPQAVVLSAPTGAGKTVIATALSG